MHMTDALLSPVVGGIMTGANIATIGYAVKKLSADKLDEKKIPMMGVMGAFVFAAQMVNFTIPGTGSSGHIGGGILLAALLGPFPAFLTLASVLLIQCLFFADGGLLAYGCNAFNLGVCACLLVYPMVYKPIVQKGLNNKRITIASIVSVVVALQIGSFFVVLETLTSGISALPFGAFFALMQPIHLAIGLVEGIVTASVLCFIHQVRPELLESAIQSEKITTSNQMKKVLLIFFVLTLLVAGGLSQFASAFPDGLEWSIQGVAGTTELAGDNGIHELTEKVIDATAMMPNYAVGGKPSGSSTATAGIVGSGITIILASAIGFTIQATKKKAMKKQS